MKKQPEPLTYGEIGVGCLCCEILEWMHKESLPVPKTRLERNVLLNRWLLIRREEMYQALLKKLKRKKRK